ncbi:MAG TPA: TlpA disulfide reductase family protein [Candidatus Polarisedimenticolaceae bacterium]|nr:TlpA disulfide reductase family protein [Candidatus Polarisedimenticolaceae bacterium]
MERLLPLLALRGVWILSGIALAALTGIWLLGRGRRFLVPARWPARILAGVLLGVVGVSGLLLYGITGPLAPMLRQISRMQHAVDRPAAELAYRAVADDAPHRLSELRGSVVLLNLWATWCPPCRRELPDLDRLQKAYAGQGLVVVTLSNEEREALQQFAARYPTSTVNVYTPDLDWMDVDGRPLTLVIDRQGVVRACFIGTRSYGAFEREVTPWLGQG